MLAELKHHLKKNAWFRLASEVRWCVKSHRQSSKSKELAVISLGPASGMPTRGNVLISYIINGFLLKDGEPIPAVPTNYWETMQMARTFQDLGYSVDVIHWTNEEFVPRKKYDVFIDVRRNLQRLSPLLDRNCIKIMHADTSHMLFTYVAEANRLLAVQRRRGVTLQPRRFEWPNLGIEHADCAVVIGNESTMNTYGYADKPMYPVPVTSVFTCPSPEGKDFEACRRHYIWFGSGGLVLKGLDLLLDAFAGMPEYELTIIGPIGKEEDFVRAYRKELYETKNIHLVGWLDTSSPEFLAITQRCLGLVYPSAAEGQSGGVAVCLHAGLIPIISYESGISVKDFGVLLRDCSIEEIRKSVRSVSSLPADKLKTMALEAWEYARLNHTRDKYAEEYRRAIANILEDERFTHN